MAVKIEARDLNHGTGRAPVAGIGVARMIGHVTYLSDGAMREKFGRRWQEPERRERQRVFEQRHAVETHRDGAVAQPAIRLVYQVI